MKTLIAILIILTPFFSFAQLEEEPNNDTDNATVIICNNFIEGYIQELEDVDWYQIEITYSGILEAQLYSVAANLDLDLSIFIIENNQPKRISSDGDTNSNGGQSLTTTAYLNPGTYYIRIVDENNNAFNDQEPYTLNIVCEENSSEVNQTFELATEMSIDTCFEDNIWGENECFFNSNIGANDRDWFKLEIPETGILNVNVNSVPSNLDLDLGIYQIVNNQTIRISSDGDTNSNSGQSLTTTAYIDAGIYYLKVVDENNNATNQEIYNLCSAFYPNELEINQTFELSTEISVDSCYEDNIWGENETFFDSNLGSNDRDWYKINLVESGVLYADVFSVPSNIDLNLAIYKVVNNQLMRISDDGDTNSSGGQSLSTAAMVNEGTYYILIHDENNNATNQETYSFCLEFTPNALEVNQTFELASYIPTDTCFEETIWGENECFFDSNFGSNDRDWFQIEVLESGIINAEVSSVPFLLDLNIGIYEVNNNQLQRISDDDAFDAGGGQSVSSTAYVNEGTYLILVHDENDNFIINEPFIFCVEFFPNEFEINQTIELAAKIPIDTCFEENSWGQNENFIVGGIPLTSYDKDWFEIEVDNECIFKASATNIPLLIQPDLKLYEIVDGNEVMIAEDDVLNADSGESVFLEQTLDKGIYYLLFSDEISLSLLNDRETFDLCFSCQAIVNNKEIGFLSDINVYPNPFNNVLQIEASDLLEQEVEIKIVDISGRIIYSEATLFSKNHEVSTSNIPSGMLFITIQSKDKIFTKKMMKH